MHAMDANDPSAKSHLLLVDDSPADRQALADVLELHYEVTQLDSAGQALERLATLPAPDLVVLRLGISGLGGLEVCRRSKSHPSSRDIPIVVIADSAEVDDADEALALGAADYLIQPINPNQLLCRVATHLSMALQSRVISEQNAYFSRELELRTRELNVALDVFALAVATLSEMRDSETTQHILRLQSYIRVLLERLRLQPRWQPLLTDNHIAAICRSVPLYDIGSIGVPDRVLLKPGALNPVELAIMKTHTTLGFQAFEKAERILQAQPQMVVMVKEMIYSHQEKWDGSGYPQGLAGEQIPFSARVMALADVYDALIGNKVYKDGVAHDKAVQIIFQERGAHFDPDLVDAFIEVQHEFEGIAKRLADTEADMQQKIEYMANAIAENAEL